MPRRSKSKSAAIEYRSKAAAEPMELVEPVGSQRRVSVVVLLVIGVCIFVALGPGRGIGWQRWLAIWAIAAVSLVPPVSRRIERFLHRLRNPSATATRWSSPAVFVCATAYLIFTAFLQERDLFPKTHDEYSYALGMQMLARGRLWMPPHPLGDFFESFYILSRPVYASIYFPGTALMFAPTVWLNLPTWLGPAMVGGAAVALLFGIISELIDPAAAWLSVLLVLSSTWFRTITMMLMSQAPMLLLGLAIIWAWLRWRNNRRWYWLLATGIFAGWAAITRPIDAIAFALPVGIGFILDLQGKPLPAWLKPAAMIVVGAAPFLTLQAIFDIGVTGHLWQTPYTLYLQREQPGATFGFHTFDPIAKGQSTLPQMRKDLEFSKTYFAVHEPGNFWKPWLATQHPPGFAERPAYFAMIADTTLPARFLLLLLPVGLLGLHDRRRFILWLTFPLFVLFYVLNPFFLEHYAILLMPAAVLSLLLSVEILARTFPRYRGQIRAVLTGLIVAAAVTGLWEINHFLVADPQYRVSDEPLPSPLLRKSHDLHGQRAVVLFKWDPMRNWKEEPVCNSDVAWPDDAEVVRAHDRGPRDAEIIDYYAKVQPDRAFFLWDQKADKLGRLGTAADLHHALQAGQKLETLMHAGQ